MKKHELAQQLLTMSMEIDKAASNCRITLKALFQSNSEDNELVELEGKAHDAMVEYLIASHLNASWSKEYKATKTSLDGTVEALSDTSDGLPGQTVELHRSNVFSFSKKQNVGSSSLSVTDLLNALARAGVEKSVLDEAKTKASKPKRGNVYYEIEVVKD